MEQKDQKFVNAQRLRFEAFSTFATELNKCLTYPDVCTVLTTYTKFVLDCYVFRIYYIYQSTELAFEVFQGECKFEQHKPNIAYAFEKQLIKTGLPVNYHQHELLSNSLFEGTIFNNKRIVLFSALPINYAADHQILVSLGSKEHNHLVELDFRFLKLISELLSNKLFQLRLTETVALKNSELESKNAEITNLNKNLTKIVTKRTHELTESNEELKTLFYRTSHDFRTPLTNIMGLANLASITTDDKDVLELFEQCKKVADGMDKMLAKLNFLTESLEHKHQLISFDAILTQLKQRFEGRLENCAVTLTYQIAKLPNFLSNAEILTMVFETLLDNSLNYCKGPLTVHIRIAALKNFLTIKFEDDGPGIEKATLPKIFDMYFRGNPASTGHGLGLYIVKKVLKSINGDISVRSKPNASTIFIIKLPL